MTRRWQLGVMFLGLVIGSPTLARAQATDALPGGRYIDADGGLSLDEAVARALAQEPSLRAIRCDIDVAKGALRQAALRPNPSASFERREEPGGTDNLTTVSVTWPLDLFRRRGRVAVADLEVASATLTAAERERQLAADVRLQYGDAVARGRELAILDEVAGAARRQYELLRARVDEGASPPLDRDVVDIELRRLEADRLLQAGRVDAAVVKLKRLLGMPPGASLTLRDSLEALARAAPVSAGADVSPSNAPVDGRADVRKAALRVDVADAKLNRAERQGRFDMGLYGSYMRMDSGFPQRGFGPAGTLERVRGQFSYVSAGASVTLPLFNRSQGEVASARAERVRAAAELEASRLDAEAERAAATLQYEHAREGVNFYADGTRALAKQNLSVVSQSYELGRITVFDVIAEQRRYLEVERAYTEALRTLYEAATALKLARGEVK